VIRENNLTTSSFDVVVALSSGNYRFWVRAINVANNVPGPWSIPFDFSVADTEPETSEVDVLLTSFKRKGFDLSNVSPQETTDDPKTVGGHGPYLRQASVPIVVRGQNSLAKPVARGDNNSGEDGFVNAVDQQISRMVESGLWIDED